MNHPTILRVALPVPRHGLFDYLAPKHIDYTELKPGMRIRVPLLRRQLVGVLLEVCDQSLFPMDKLKAAYEILDPMPILSTEIISLCKFAADYYHCGIGEVFACALPNFLRKIKQPRRIVKNEKKAEESVWREDSAIEQALALNATQQSALSAISKTYDRYQTFLLDGVTGSGKTEVYLRAITEVLANNGQVLVLIPEISLTPQTLERFRKRFLDSIVAYHSGLSERERWQNFELARTHQAKIVIGTRSAIFIPFADLRLIIVDEEHDNSFKQQERFRYHARDLAILRAKYQKIPIVLGSATPSLESLYNAKRGRYHYLSLPKRAGVAELPQYLLVDLRRDRGSQGLSSTLFKAIETHLNRGNQVMLFLNRRGFAPVLYCLSCGWIAACKRCDTRMVYHLSPPRLQCHHCDAISPLKTHCEACNKGGLQPVGLGTERLHQTLAKYFPSIPIIRVDRDNTKHKGALEELLKSINQAKQSILLGTQMLAKGHHFPNVTLVGIIDADGGLFSADFRAVEEMGQLLLQVSGRAGRSDKPGTVIVQTRNPDHPLLQILIKDGYRRFAEALLHEREMSGFPPFAYLAVLRADAHTEKDARSFLQQIKELFSDSAHAVTLLGPIPALIAKRKGRYCQQLLIKSTTRKALQAFLHQLTLNMSKVTLVSKVRFVLDVDPIEVF